MKIKALRPLNGHYGQKNPGDEFVVGDALGNSLVRRGVAMKVAGPPPRSRTANTVDNKAASGPLAGSLTGADALASSSVAAPAPRGRTSRRSGAKATSSSSTKAGA